MLGQPLATSVGLGRVDGPGGQGGTCLQSLEGSVGVQGKLLSYPCISQGGALIKWCCVYVSRRVLNFHISSVSNQEHLVLAEEGNILPWPKDLRTEN